MFCSNLTWHEVYLEIESQGFFFLKFNSHSPYQISIYSLTLSLTQISIHSLTLSLTQISTLTHFISLSLSLCALLEVCLSSGLRRNQPNSDRFSSLTWVKVSQEDQIHFDKVELEGQDQKPNYIKYAKCLNCNVCFVSPNSLFVFFGSNIEIGM